MRTVSNKEKVEMVLESSVKKNYTMLPTAGVGNKFNPVIQTTI